MKLIDLIEMIEPYTTVKITATFEQEWDESNPCFFGLIGEISYRFVKSAGQRTVAEITAFNMIENGEHQPCINILYAEK